jgi:hypothetical protein
MGVAICPVPTDQLGLQEKKGEQTCLNNKKMYNPKSKKYPQTCQGALIRKLPANQDTKPLEGKTPKRPARKMKTTTSPHAARVPVARFPDI